MADRTLPSLVALCVAAWLLVGPVDADPPVGAVPETLPKGPVLSGPQIGDRPGTFQSFNVTGPNAGRRSCLHCKYGLHPVAMVFVRELPPQLLPLIKTLDAATAAHADVSMGSCLIVCSDTEDLAPQLEQLARRETLNHLILATCPAEGPKQYRIAPDAEVTIVLYTHGVVKANYAFRKGELTPFDVHRILADLPKILTDQPDTK